MPRRPWTQQEDRILRELADFGWSGREIAEAMLRGEGSIDYRVALLGIKLHGQSRNQKGREITPENRANRSKAMYKRWRTGNGTSIEQARRALAKSPGKPRIVPRERERARAYRKIMRLLGVEAARAELAAGRL